MGRSDYAESILIQNDIWCDVFILADMDLLVGILHPVRIGDNDDGHIYVCDVISTDFRRMCLTGPHNAYTAALKMLIEALHQGCRTMTYDATSFRLV